MDFKNFVNMNNSEQLNITIETLKDMILLEEVYIDEILFGD